MKKFIIFEVDHVFILNQIATKTTISFIFLTNLNNRSINFFLTLRKLLQIDKMFLPIFFVGINLSLTFLLLIN